MYISQRPVFKQPAIKPPVKSTFVYSWLKVQRLRDQDEDVRTETPFTTNFFVCSWHGFPKVHKRNGVVRKTLNTVTHWAKKRSWNPLIMACGSSGIISGCHTSTELSSPPAFLRLLGKITGTDYSSVFHFSSLTLWSGGEKWGERKREKGIQCIHQGAGESARLNCSIRGRGIRLWKWRTVWTRDTGHFKRCAEMKAWLMGPVFSHYCWK